MTNWLSRWFYPCELSRVEVVKQLFALSVIRPPKPHRNLVLVRGARDVWRRKVA